MIRRTFLRTLSFAAGALGWKPAGLSASLLQSLPDADPDMRASAAAATDTLRLFQHPPARYRPMVRWWWNGDRVDAQELLRELDVLKAAGIGGVEINPIKLPDGADPLQTQALPWLSDPWIDVLEVVLKGAKQRDLTCDMIVGSGWPFGGEWLPRADQTQMMALGTRDVMGPCRVDITPAELLADVTPAFVSAYTDPAKELFALRLVPEELASEQEAVRLDAQVTRDRIVCDVPEGRHVIYFLVKLTGFMAVINGAPGANGPVLNHFDAGAVDRYLNRLSDRLNSRIGPLSSLVRAFFTDSIELEGANWCDDMAAEFHRRRGYDLLPWLPFILFKVGEMGNAVSGRYGANFTPELRERVERVRYDFETLRRELFGERFVGTFVAWCKRLGVKSRMQAYGTECDVMSASRMLDIPECETWIRSEAVQAFGSGDYRVGRNYTMINKFVSSAAHLFNKRLISCEEMTNTDDPFGVSLNRIKVAGDQSVLSGVTQSVLHGFNYSPKEAPFPGWVRYGTYFSERNTWWPYFKLWTDYKARLSYLFQQADMQADIAILPPFADLASRFGFQRDPFPRVAYPAYLFKLWEAVHSNGSGCDYVDEAVLQQSSISAGRLLFAKRSYKAVLLADVESLQPQTARVLQDFVRSGGIVLLLGKTPHEAPGLAGDVTSQGVTAVFESLVQQHGDRAALVEVDEGNLIAWYRGLQQRYELVPDVAMSAPADFISQVHYADADRDYYFLANFGAEETRTLRATFSARRGREAWVWDPVTGARAHCSALGTDGALEITLSPSESTIVVFEQQGSRSKGRSPVPGFTGPESAAREEQIAGPWTIELDRVDGVRTSEKVQSLEDEALTRLLRDFSGKLTYKTSAPLLAAWKRCWIDVGPLPHGVSELWVNGTKVGVRWFGSRHVYEVPHQARTGESEVEIRVTTTLGNYAKSLRGNLTAEIWTKRTPFYPCGLSGPVRLFYS